MPGLLVTSSSDSKGNSNYLSRISHLWHNPHRGDSGKEPEAYVGAVTRPASPMPGLFRFPEPTLDALANGKIKTKRQHDEVVDACVTLLPAKLQPSYATYYRAYPSALASFCSDVVMPTASERDWYAFRLSIWMFTGILSVCLAFWLLAFLCFRHRFYVAKKPQDQEKVVVEGPDGSGAQGWRPTQDMFPSIWSPAKAAPKRAGVPDAEINPASSLPLREEQPQVNPPRLPSIQEEGISTDGQGAPHSSQVLTTSTGDESLQGPQYLHQSPSDLQEGNREPERPASMTTAVEQQPKSQKATSRRSYGDDEAVQ